MEEEITLFEHNEEAYNDLVSSLENCNFSFIERATGTGKSYILIKYLATMMKGKKVLFVTNHEPMFDQFINQDMPILGTSKDIYDKLDLVLYSSIPKHDAQYYYNNYDCIIFDEAHHCGADVWGETIGELRDLIKNSDTDKKMIGATATGTRYLDDYMDVAAEFFEGNVANRLSLAEAILRELLPTPYYINTLTTCQEELDKVKSKLKRIGNRPEFEDVYRKINELQEKVTIDSNPNEQLKKYNVRPGEKYIVFCSSKEDLKRKKTEANVWFKDIGSIKEYEVHSGQTKVENKKAIDDYKHATSDDIHLMFAIDIFNEGMHIDGVDGIIMTRKTNSPIVYLQQIGRALSFSARKKQIKIFDFAGNATGIDIVFSLYKELIEEARENSNLYPDNKEHYEEIIERFRIVNEGAEIIDEITEINDNLQTNYIDREEIKKAIKLLQVYIDMYNIHFMKELELGTVPKEYVDLFKLLSKKSVCLTFDQIVKLNDLGVILNQWQQDKSLLDKIDEFGSYKNYEKVKSYKTFSDYSHFYVMNNHRVSIDEDETLYREYRKQLVICNKNQLMRKLNNAPYPLNVEEKLLLREYPSNEEIDDYLSLMEEKIVSGKVLDELEFKVIRCINSLGKVQSDSMIGKTLNNDTFKIDYYIDLLKKEIEKYDDYKITYKDIDFLEGEVKRAYTYIYGHFQKINNRQFEKLLELDIEIPKDYQMTMEERLQILGDFDSFDELNIANQNRSYKIATDFINAYGRKPDPKKQSEKEIVNAIANVLRNSKQSKRLLDLYDKNNFELNVDEKIILRKPIEKDELEKILSETIDIIKNGNIVDINYSFLENRIDLLYSSKVIDSKYKNLLKRTIALQSGIYNIVAKDSSSTNTTEIIQKRLWSNQQYITKNLLSYLMENGIKIDYTIIAPVMNSNDNFINRAHKKYIDVSKKLDEYFDYLKQNGSRPQLGTILDQSMRKYLLSSSQKDRLEQIKKINGLGIPITLEEGFLIDSISIDSQMNLYNIYSNSVKNGKKLDDLSQKIFQELEYRRRMGMFNKGTEVKEVRKMQIFSCEDKEDKTLPIKANIKRNPFDELFFKEKYPFLTDNERKELNDLLCDTLAEILLPEVIKELKETNLLVENILQGTKLYAFNLLMNEHNNKGKYKMYFMQIKELEKSNFLSVNKLVLDQFISEYVMFATKKNRVPVVSSDDEYERKLAMNFEKIIKFMDKKDVVDFKNEINKVLNSAKAQSAYDRVISFIEQNERFPSPLSDDSEEVKLAEDFKQLKLTGERKIEMNKLIKKYQKNNIKYMMQLKERKEENKNGNRL